MEKELRINKNRAYFQVPLITTQGNKIETLHGKDKVLEAVDQEVSEMLTALKQSGENYEKEQEQIRIRDEQLRSARQTNRSDFNFATLANVLLASVVTLKSDLLVCLADLNFPSKTPMQDQTNQAYISIQNQLTPFTSQPV